MGRFDCIYLLAHLHTNDRVKYCGHFVSVVYLNLLAFSIKYISHNWNQAW
jgi:hypothetical protein